MRRGISILIVTVLIALPSAAAAGGSWTVIHAAESGGNEYRDVGIMQANKIYMVGLYSPGLFTETRAWIGSLSGLLVSDAISVAYTDLCDFAHMFSTIDSVSYVDSDSGLAGGGSVPDSCTWLFPFPYCEACLLLYEPTVWQISSGGTSLSPTLTRGAVFGSMLQVEYLNENTAVATTSTGNFYRSYSYADEWEEIYGPSGSDGIYADMDFANENLGAILVNTPTDDRLSGRRPETIEDAIERLAYQRHAKAWFTDPAYRLNKSAQTFEPVRSSYSGCWLLFDAALTWSGAPLFEKADVNLLKTSWYSEKYGLVASDEPASETGAQFTIYYTHDGGENWAVGTLPAEGPGADGTYDIGDIRYVSSKIGYAVGAAKDTSTTNVGFILETFDGGETWNFNAITTDAPLNAMDFKGRTLGYMVGKKSFIAKYTGTNDPPTADAGPDKTVAINDEVYLDGSDSNDPDDFIDSYLWEQTGGPAVDMTWEDEPTMGFIADSGTGTLTFKLTITAGGETDSDTVTVTVLEEVDDDVTDDVTDDATDDSDDSDDDGWHGDDETDDASDDTSSSSDDDDGIPDSDDDDLSTHGPQAGEDSSCCG